MTKIEVIFLYISSEIANRIKTLAKTQKIKLSEMLEVCELSKNTLSSMISGGSTPKSENLAKIADYLGCSVDYLLGRTDVPQNAPASLSEEEAELLQQYRSLDEQGKSKVDEYLSDCTRLYGLVRQELPNGYAITTNRHEIPPAVLEEAEALRKKV